MSTIWLDELSTQFFVVVTVSAVVDNSGISARMVKFRLRAGIVMEVVISFRVGNTHIFQVKNYNYG
ncbi:MAG: hypothetical protein KKH61_20310, partial [Gammaproteobacteria bacterium]|nr:hypothetical protein [Gammaproteobacteria bacterium]